MLIDKETLETEMNLLRTFVEENKKWVERNFSNRAKHHPFLGIVEELGELDEAKTSEEINDAIGDTMIFTADFCTAQDLPFVELWKIARMSKIDERSELAVIGRFSHALLKRDQKIRGSAKDHTDAIVAGVVNVFHVLMGTYISLLNVSQLEAGKYVVEAMEEAWKHVRDRIWRCTMCSKPLLKPVTDPTQALCSHRCKVKFEMGEDMVATSIEKKHGEATYLLPRQMRGGFVRSTRQALINPYRVPRETARPNIKDPQVAMTDSAPAWVFTTVDAMLPHLSQTPDEGYGLIRRALDWCEKGNPEARAHHLQTVIQLWPGDKESMLHNFLIAAVKTRAGRIGKLRRQDVYGIRMNDSIFEDIGEGVQLFFKQEHLQVPVVAACPNCSGGLCGADMMNACTCACHETKAGARA